VGQVGGVTDVCVWVPLSVSTPVVNSGGIFSGALLTKKEQHLERPEQAWPGQVLLAHREAAARWPVGLPDIHQHARGARRRLLVLVPPVAGILSEERGDATLGAVCEVCRHGLS